ncbi:MAG: hypothetical protein KJ717_01820 [Proteobacteria bacterium]|nr:hypothetical protein [Pseudomonadota bacterium]
MRHFITCVIPIAAFSSELLVHHLTALANILKTWNNSNHCNHICPKIFILVYQLAVKLTSCKLAGPQVCVRLKMNCLLSMNRRNLDEGGKTLLQKSGANLFIRTLLSALTSDDLISADFALIP